jgi:protein TonB
VAPDVGPKPLIRMTLPKVAQSEDAKPDSPEIDPLDALLPKPALDFSAAPVGGPVQETRSLYDIYRPVRKGIGKFRLALLSGLVLGVLLVAAWYKNWLSFPSLGGTVRMIHVTHDKKLENGSARHAAPAASSSTIGAPDEATTAPEGATPTAEDPAATPNPSSAGASKPSTSAAVPVAAPKTKKPAIPATVSKRVSVKDGGGSAGAPSKSASGAASSPAVEPAQPVQAESDAPVVPPKLLRWVNPVYPPEAMLAYITGDVRVDAVVDPNGRIGALKILGGPLLLRQAAVDALKQYEYAPATQGGRPVAAHVNVTVKFWFNP